MHLSYLAILAPLAMASPMATTAEANSLAELSTAATSTQAATAQTSLARWYLVSDIQTRTVPRIGSPSGQPEPDTVLPRAAEVPYLRPSSKPEHSEPYLTVVPRTKFFCAAVRVEKSLDKNKSDKWSVTCNSEVLPIPAWVENFVRQCVHKVKKTDVAYTVKGDKDVAECSYHKQWVMNAPMEEAYETVHEMELRSGSDDVQTMSTKDINAR